ncbi:uncharacterized protein TNCV_4437951 [Trichonephila clavipes]|nr:uncharacterized protein TNCV_4437951 [Trichonephila clavipes]
MGAVIPNVLQPGAFVWFKKTQVCHTGAPNEGTNCAWRTDNEAVGRTRAFLTMWCSSRRLVCRERPEPDLRVNDISQIHWSQHFLTTQFPSCR